MAGFGIKLLAGKGRRHAKPATGVHLSWRGNTQRCRSKESVLFELHIGLEPILSWFCCSGDSCGCPILTVHGLSEAFCRLFVGVPKVVEVLFSESEIIEHVY
jgi:hypothetical protein